MTPVFYKCLFPATIFDEPNRTLDLGLGPANSSPAQTKGHDPNHLFSLSFEFTTIYFDAKANEIGRQHWTTTKPEPAPEGTTPLNPADIRLGDLPPIVEGCGEGGK